MNLLTEKNIVHINLTEEYLSGLKKHTGIDMMVGFDSRKYIIIPDGNYLINPVTRDSFSNIDYSKSGSFISFNKSIFNNKLKLGVILMTDKNDYFLIKINPRFTAVYSDAYQHNFRFSFQSGYRFPSISEAFSIVNSGGVKRVSGLPVMSNAVFDNALLQSSISSFQSAVLTDINLNGLSKMAAITKNKGLLKINPYTYLKPEQVKSFEAGY